MATARNSLVYNDINPILQHGEIGNEADLYNADQKIANARAAGTAKLAGAVVNGVNELINSELQIKMVEQLQDSYNTFATDPNGFKENIKAIGDGLVSGYGSLQQKTEIRNKLNNAAEKYYLKIVDNQIKLQDDQTLEQTILGNENILKDSIPFAIDNIVNPNEAIGISGAEQLGQVSMEFLENINKKNSRGMPFFSAEKRASLARDFDASLLNTYAQKQLEALPTTQEKLNFLQDLYSGKASLKYNMPMGGEINISTKDLGDKQRNALQKNLNAYTKQLLEKQRDEQSLQYMQDVAEGKEIPDPKSKHYREDVDKVFKNEIDLSSVNVTNPMARELTANKVANFVSTYKTIPETLNSNLRGLLNSNSPNHFALASNVIDNIRINSPEQLDLLPGKDLSRAYTMINLIKSGVPADEAFNSIQKTFSQSPELIKEREKDLANAIYTSDLDLSINAIREGHLWWKDDLPVSDLENTEFKTQFKTLIKNEYLKGADLNTAYQTASKIISERWGVTRVNDGKHLTALPPEKYYEDSENGLTPEWMKDQAYRYAKTLLNDENLDPKKVLVIADNITYQQAGDSTSQPTYSLNLLTDNGLEPILDNNNNFARVGSNIWWGDHAYNQILLTQYDRNRVYYGGGIPVVPKRPQKKPSIMTDEEKMQAISEQTSISQKALDIDVKNKKEFLKWAREQGLNARNADHDYKRNLYNDIFYQIGLQDAEGSLF